MCSRVVGVNVDVVERRLLQTEDVDHDAVQDIAGLSEELVEAPTFLLVSLQDVGQHWSEETLKTPETHTHTVRHASPHQPDRLRL